LIKKAGEGVFRIKNVFKSISFFLLFALFIFLSENIYSQEGGEFTLSGRVYNSTSKKTVDFATVVILEARVKGRTFDDGLFSVTVPEAGEYTVMIRSQGLRLLKLKLKINRDMKRDFWLKPVRVRGGALTIFGERNIQKVSRYTMTSQDIKDVPATFGDSINALTALPGVIRTGSFFGPLVIRGASSTTNRYFIDDIPLYNPQHFGGIHSVISNDFIREIDLYASSFPAQFGSANGAVININTIDNVKEFGGYTDIGIISANSLFKVPIFRKEPGEDGKEEKKNCGYLVAGGRVAYLSLFVPLIYKVVTGDEIDSVPEYWDYQVKFKYQFNKRHSISMLFLGNKDYFTFINKETMPEEVDPLFEDIEFETDTLSNSQGIYYTYEPSVKFKNTILLTSSLNDSYNYINMENAASWLHDFNISSKPNIFGIKDKLRFEWWKDHAELRAAIEATYYYFKLDGYTLVPDEYDFIGIPDFGNENEFYLEPLGDHINNFTAGAYLENKFQFGGLTLTPGVRSDFLYRTKTATVDFRGLVSYEFPTRTIVSVAGGQYSSFIKVNPYVFNNNADLASEGEVLKPERALHSVLGFEQKISLFTFKLEGFYNYFYDLAFFDDTAPGDIRCNGKQKAYGIETMLRVDREEGRGGLFGWINYTWTQSKLKSGVYNDINGDRYVDFGGDALRPGGEQEHALKLVAGYTVSRHTFSTRFQLYTSFPYTPITGSDETTPGRFVPVMDEADKNSKHFPLDHRLDVRYSYKTTYEWGYVSWYIEVINVYNHQAIDGENWDYSEPYSEGNNPVLEAGEGLAFIPNFGVEVKF